MLRSSRTTAALIRSLLLGTAAITTTVAVSSVMVGCKDESQPEYWVEKLDDPKWRPEAVKRLTQFLDDALGKANNDMQNAEVQALLNKLVDPLTKIYVDNYGDLDTKSRVALIKLLADFRDKRAEPALKKAFDEFAARPKKTKDEADIKWAVRAYGEMKLESLAPSVLAAFEKLQAHTPLGGIVYRDYNEAMIAAPSKSWASSLIQKLGADIKPPQAAKTKEEARDLIDPYRDQLFWQQTAAQVLGELRDPAAVDALLKVVLDPFKGDIGSTAQLALVKIGKPAVEAAAKVVDGSNKKLIDYHIEKLKAATGAKEAPKGNPALMYAAQVIGVAGRPEGIPPLLKALNQSDATDADKTIIAISLTKIPATAESKEAFKKTFESIPLDATVQGNPALALLAEESSNFYDSGMVPWLLDRAQNTKGGGDEKKTLQQTAIQSALKLAMPDQLAQVSAAAARYGAKDLVPDVEKVLKECGEKVECYLNAIEKSEYQDKKHQLAGIKAGYMIGILGDAKARDSLIDRLSSIENASVRFVAAKTIDHLTPKGSPEVVEKLDAIISKNLKSADKDKIEGDAPLKQVSYRLSARGG